MRTIQEAKQGRQTLFMLAARSIYDMARVSPMVETTFWMDHAASVTISYNRRQGVDVRLGVNENELDHVWFRTIQELYDYIQQ